MDGQASTTNPTNAAATGNLLSLMPPKRPVRINGLLSLPMELWLDIITKTVSVPRMLFCHAEGPRLSGIVTQDVQRTITTSMGPFEGIPGASEHAEKEVWLSTEVVFQFNSRHDLSTSIRSWTRRIDSWCDKVKRLHILIHDRDDMTWKSPYRNTEHERTLNADPQWAAPVHHLADSHDPILAVKYVIMRCSQLESVTVQVLHSQIRVGAGPRSSRQDLALALDGKLMACMSCLHKMKTARSMPRVVLAVMPADMVHGTRTIPVPANRTEEEGKGYLVGMNQQDVVEDMVYGFFAPSGTRSTSRVAVQLA